MPELVALGLPGGDRWIDELERAWEAGDAVAPLDLRLPGPALSEQLEALAPTIVVDDRGRHRRDGGRPVQPGDALVVSTSGTTGAARAAVLTHDSLAEGARATSAALGVRPGADRWVACLPLAHVGGLGVVVRALLTGTPLEVHDGFDATRVRDAASRGASLVSLVPAVLSRIDPSAFRRILLGGSAIPPARPVNSVATYGMTETGGGVVYDGVPLEGVECRVVDDEIQLRCPMLLRSYRDGTEPLTEDGWYPTGDGGYIDRGVLVVEGRLGDVIVTGGEKVWPQRVEPVLDRHPDVRAVAVVGRPDPEWGERVTALVEPRDATRPPSLESLRELATAELPAWCAPRGIELVESLPRTALGKIRRRDI